MDPARLLRFRRACVRAGDAPLLRVGAALGQRGARRALDAVDALLAVVLAPRCLACDAAIDAPLAGPICDACWQTVRPPLPPLCDQCGDTLASWRLADGSGDRCPRCRRCAAIVTRTRAAGEYHGPLRVAIHALKYDGRRSIANRLSALMRLHAGEVLHGAAAVVPVPLHASRHRARGFNQAADLARGLGLPVAHLLSRVRPTVAQADLPSAQRHRNVRDAFAPTRLAASWKGRTLVLVDDVSTTGATLESCGRVLVRVGAGEVRAITAAKAVTAPR